MADLKSESDYCLLWFHNVNSDSRYFTRNKCLWPFPLTTLLCFRSLIDLI